MDEGGYRAAPAVLRLLAGLVDLAVVVAISTGLFLATEEVAPLDWPPRYWNYLDYFADLFWSRPEIIYRIFGIFGLSFFLWGVFWTCLVGNAPVARLFGMQVVTRKGKRPGVMRAMLRTLFFLLFSAMAFLGPSLALLDPKRRTLHDIMTGCYVLLGGPSKGEDAASLETDEGYREGPKWL